MGCDHVQLPDGGFAIICTRGRRAPAPCSRCKARPHEVLCDWPLTGRAAGKTCSAKLCRACAVSAGDRDYCPPHAKLGAAQLELAPADPGLDLDDLFRKDPDR